MTALPNFGDVGKDIKSRLDSLEDTSSTHTKQISTLSEKVTALEKAYQVKPRPFQIMERESQRQNRQLIV